MRSFLAIAVVAAATLAGCQSDDRDDPVTPPQDTGLASEAELAAAHPFTIFLCKDGFRVGRNATQPAAGAADGSHVDRCNHRVTKPLLDPSLLDVRSQHGPANEVSVAVDPNNPLRVAAGAKDYTVSYVSDVAQCGEYTVWMGTYWSEDGGVTWGNDLMPGFPGDNRTSALRGNWCNTDPVLVFDDDGTLWYSGLNYDGAREDAATATAPGAQHDLYTGSQLYFARSDDGGATYGPITFAAFGDDDAVFNDKQWFAVQPGGDHMVATWSVFAPVSSIWWVESLDAGQTWTAPRPMPPGSFVPVGLVQDSMPQYLPGGDRVAVTWVGFGASLGGPGSHIVYTEGIVSPAGTTFLPPRSAFPYNPIKSGQERDGTGASSFRSGTIPALAVDTSGGEHDGRRYVVWADQPGQLDSDVQVLMRWSDDGIAWSDAAPVNDVPDGDQLFPWVSVDPLGGVHVAWYDRRNDPDNDWLDIYYAYSDDGGESFHTNVRVTETGFDGDLGHHQEGQPFIGDYMGVSAGNASVTIAWAETRHTGEAGREAGSDVYSATLVRDAAATAVFRPTTSVPASPASS